MNIDVLKEKLASYSRDEFEVGLPYSDAKQYSSDYDEFQKNAIIVKEAGAALGIPDTVLDTLRSAFEAIFFPYHDRYFIQNDEKRFYPIAPFSASELWHIKKMHIEEDDVNIWLDIGDYYIAGNAVRGPCRKNSGLSDVEFCSHFIMPIGVLISPASLNALPEEKYIVMFKRFGQTHTIIVPKNIALSTSKVKQLVKLGIDSGDRGLLATFFNDIENYNRGINPDFKVITEIDHLGWIGDNWDAFYPYNRIDFQGSNLSSFRREYDSVVSMAGNLDEWRNLINQYRDDSHVVLRIVLAASFSSVLVKPLGALNYGLHIWSSMSGSGKTVALMTAASIWAKPTSGGGFIRSLNATKNACEQLSQFLCNLPLCLDELQTVRKKEMDDLIYNLCEGIPRARASGIGGVRNQNPWQNCFITTGEQPITSAGSSMGGAQNRVIEIECPGPLFVNDPVKMNHYCSLLFSNYNTAGRAFVSYLSNADNLRRAQELHSEYTKAFSIKGVTSKQASSAALILTADTLASEWIFGDELKLTVEDLLPYLKKDADISTPERAHQYIVEWIARNMPKLGATSLLGRIQIKGGKKICCIPKAEFTKILMNQGFDADAYKKWAKREGRIVTDKDGHLEKKVTINGVHNVYCVCIIYDEAVQPEDESVDEAE